MNDRTYIAYKKWISFHDLPGNEESIDIFYKEFIGIFRTYMDFYAHVYNIPRNLFTEEDLPFKDFDDLYYTNTVVITVDKDEPYDGVDMTKTVYRGVYIAFYKRTNDNRTRLYQKG